MKNEEQQLARKKVEQIFKYLQALDQLRNPVKKQIGDQLWSLWFGDLPLHMDVECPFLQTQQEDLDTYLKIRKPDLTMCPGPPKELLTWLLPGWEKIEKEPEFLESKETDKDENDEVEVEHFHDDNSRVKVYQDWLEERSDWKENEIPARKTMKIFERLYDLYAWIERDSEQVELILGDGILDWRMAKGTNISHPVLLQKVKLTFDPDVPEFKLIPLEVSVEFYSALFRDVQEVSAASIQKCTLDLEQNQYMPLDKQETDDYLKRVISHLSAKGVFYPFDTPKQLNRNRDYEPIIHRNPVLFLRKRSLGFTSTIERILSDINNNAVLPEAVTRITGIDIEGNNYKENVSFELDVNGQNEDVLFTKEANSEQLDIALKVNKYGSVLVQGPPGTGKTHTIANLLGHFLSEGKNVLVTSHTSKALQVLREKVAEPLRGLCVSILEEGNNQLDQSIDIITERLNSINEKSYADEIKILIRRRNDLLNRMKLINRDLKTSRENEYTPIVFMGKEILPSEAARLITNHEEKLCIVPGRIDAGKFLPLTKEEIQELYQSNNQISLEDELEFECLEIQPDQLLRPEEFELLTKDFQRLSNSVRNAHIPFWNENVTAIRKQVEQVISQAVAAVSVITDEDWKLEILSAGRDGGNAISDWIDLITEIKELIEKHKLAKSAIYKHGPELIGETNDFELAKIIEEIISFLSSGKKLSFINRVRHRSWDKAIKSIRVNQMPPSEKEHFEAILSVIDHRLKRGLVLSRWERQVESLGGPKVEVLGPEPEVILEQLGNEIEQYLIWFKEVWNNVIVQFDVIGLHWNALSNARKSELIRYSELKHIKTTVNTELAPVASSFINQLEWERVHTRHLALVHLIEPLKESDSVTRQLLSDAIYELDIQKYQKAYETICFLWNKNEVLLRRYELLKKLESVAEDWAAAISKRDGIHGGNNPPDDMHFVWKLKQLQTELDRRSSLLVDELQKELHKTRDEFKDITIQLVEKKAWLALKFKTTLKQQNALQGWKLLMKKAGKRTGIRAPQLLAEARSLMPVCQTAVPVWIMPISRVVENFNPAQNRFDVVIVDEASQADVMALTALYLGKQVVVVGDDEQVSPDAVGQKQEEVQKIIDTHLTGIPNAALYDGKTSIYDLAKTSFSGMTQLREHFRCVEPIIQFSNALSYDGKILPLRDSSNISTRPFTIEYRVEGEQSGSKTNDIEARTVVSLIMAAIEQTEYHDASFGVISLVGEEQAILIDQYLHKYLPATEYKKRKIRCGNSAQFQGDERDVIFLSMVHASDGEGPLRRLADVGEGMKKRYNVAASRARNQMWLVHSLNSSMDLKDGDLRKRLIDHFKDPTAATELFKQVESRTESEFEKEVVRRLLNEGYKVISQWPVGSYRIDIVVEGSGKRLAIECDGDRWHPLEKIGDDMARQAILERLGWSFVRIRGGEYFRSPDKAMKPVFDKLESMGITRELHSQANEQNEEGHETLKIRVLSRAAEIREIWEKQVEEYPTSPKKKGVLKKDPPISKVSAIKEVSIKSQPQKKVKREAGGQIDISEITTTFLPNDGDGNLKINLCTFLTERNIRYVDKRDKSGALWAIGDDKTLNNTMKELAKLGVEFHYRENGGQASGKKPAWFTKYKG